jgi:ribosomal-protein-serine acetyltransferase
MDQPWFRQPLTDGEICLQPIGVGDAEEIFFIVDRDRGYLREWLPWVDKTVSVKDILHFIEQAQKQFDKKTGLIICIRSQGKIAGLIGFNFFDWNNRSTLLGYWLAQDQQGQGIMTRSCALLLNYAFTELSLNRVEIRCAVENKKSRAIPERLGFKNERTIRNGERLKDQVVDLIVYVILNQEGKARR